MAPADAARPAGEGTKQVEALHVGNVRLAIQWRRIPESKDALPVG